MLEIDDKKYAQSMAISRYLGRKYGLAGATLEEDLEIDMIVDYINEIRASEWFSVISKLEVSAPFGVAA